MESLIVFTGISRKTKRTFAEDLRKNLLDRLEQQWHQIHFDSIYYQFIFQDHQHQVFQAMRPYIDWMRLRQFLLYGFSDAAGLEHGKDRPDSAYVQVQRAIREVLETAFLALGEQAGPVMIIAQSLGAHVMSNYLWDAQQSTPHIGCFATDPVAECPQEKEEFLRLRTLKRFISTGCNIPIFVAGHDPITPIDPPNQDFEWLNFYDEDDVLGWPLQPLSEPYRKLVEDIAVNSGGLMRSWNPFSHTEYWEDREVLDRVATEIRALLR